MGYGYWTHNTNKGTAPTYTTDIANYGVCLDMYDKAQAAAYFTVGSNSYKHTTNAYKAPESTTAFANCVECLATALSTNAAAFL